MITHDLPTDQPRPLRATVFRPWPFVETSVRTRATYLMTSDLNLEDQSAEQTLDKDSWDVLVELSNGKLAVTTVEYLDRLLGNE